MRFNRNYHFLFFLGCSQIQNCYLAFIVITLKHISNNNNNKLKDKGA